ncbi:Spo0B domain-containing protein [Microaerobacter geothermalis]|uniref:Spo0B domain-containing protein n=1 Tax=Microaerobacter geothermalis TaxID=674972 RepID=UPI001F29DD83|nr:Spo0B domain-containing protein [Microaerobacter geothermalis]MCF6092719.1 Spo0B domain-containing protein [Microaerobacter geothermalis]
MKWKWALLVSLILSMVGSGLFITQGRILDKFMLIALITAALVIGYLIGIWRNRYHHAERHSNFEKEWLTSISHQRHDWLNHFQVIYGYLKMGKLDRMEEYIQRVTERAHQDSRISRLGYSPLVVYLLTFNSLVREMELEVEVDEELDLSKIPVNVESLYQIVYKLVETYRANVIVGEGERNNLLLSLQLLNHAVYLSFDFQGHLNEKACRLQLQQLAKQIKNEGGIFVEGLHNREESLMEVKIPLAQAS